jgi:hypothetical protein
MSGTVFLIVLAGFAPTLYLRAFLDVPEIPAYVLLHGIVLTAWFVGVFLQATLVAAHRTDIHRRLGWIGAGLGVATLSLSLAVTLAFVPRQSALGMAALPALARIFWANLAALLCFTVFLSTAVARRRQPHVHKRLMLLAAISVVQPAIARIRGWPLFEGVDPGAFSLVGLSLLVGAVALYDLSVNRRVHIATLLGGMFFLGSRAFSLYVLAPSDFGLALVRRLAE